MDDIKEINVDGLKTFIVTVNGKRFKFTVDELSNFDITSEEPTVHSSAKTTIVTGLWDMGREELPEGFKRPYSQYKEKFAELLNNPSNMYIYVSKQDEEFVWKHRSKHNTEVKVMELEEFKTWFEFFDQVQDIRKKPEWVGQSAWMVDAPQVKLEYYNPVVMSKMFLLNNASLFNPFNSEYFYWIDAGITSTVHPGYFYHDKIFDKLEKFTDTVDAFTFLTYPYAEGTEIHGFDRKAITRYSKTRAVKYVCRGGFFGGKKEHIHKINSHYHNILSQSLSAGYMGTEESVFTILAHTHSNDVYEYELKDDGLVWPFFEMLKHVNFFIEKFKLNPRKKTSSDFKNNLYVLGFNSPEQFKTVCDSIKTADATMFEKSSKILINNSTDESLFDKYDELCVEYGFEEIHKENLGVCGGRQFAAEHFDSTDADFYMFFEDDMLINAETDSGHCKCGFEKYIPNLYDTVTKIMTQEKLDFLKFSFSEFYGDNSIQWAWYNVPQDIRTNYWPEYDKLPEFGLDENAPKTQISSINVLNDTPYAIGEIYYSNWPQIVSRAGNKKMFLETTWERPYEQTWMSHMFQLTKKKELRSGILLASPVTHNRFEHYDGSFRKES